MYLCFFPLIAIRYAIVVHKITRVRCIWSIGSKTEDLHIKVARLSFGSGVLIFAILIIIGMAYFVAGVRLPSIFYAGFCASVYLVIIWATLLYRTELGVAGDFKRTKSSLKKTFYQVQKVKYFKSSVLFTAFDLVIFFQSTRTTMTGQLW